MSRTTALLIASLSTGVLGCARAGGDVVESASESSGTDGSTGPIMTGPIMTGPSMTSSSSTVGGTSQTGGSESEGSSGGSSSSGEGSSGASESTGTAGCGNGRPDGDEPCDDGNDTPGDGCEDDCTFTIGIAAIATGERHSCALTFAGVVRCWGDNSQGQLGYGHTMNIGDDETPADAGDVDVGAPVEQITLGGYHTCALLEGGAVRCWGWAGEGQLGYGHEMNLGDDEVPADIGDVEIEETVVTIAAGGNHTCALLEDGELRCWGWNAYGQLGLGTSEDVGDDEPAGDAALVDVGAAVTEIATGATHTCALREGGTVRCWGFPENGQLGYGNEFEIGDDETPAQVGNVVLGGTAVEIGAGNAHVCVRTDDDAVRCWGWNASGQLGYGTINDIGDNELPSTAGAVAVGDVSVALSLGGQHTCSLADAGSVRCWGSNSGGRLGYGNFNSIGDNELPSTAGEVDVGGVVLSVAAGGIHTCALLEGNTVRCWGEATLGSIGYGNTSHIGDTETPASAGDVPVL